MLHMPRVPSAVGERAVRRARQATHCTGAGALARAGNLRMAPQLPACCPFALHHSPPGFHTPRYCCPDFFYTCGSQLWQLPRGGRVLLLSRKAPSSPGCG